MAEDKHLEGSWTKKLRYSFYKISCLKGFVKSRLQGIKDTI